ncbi:vanillate O-demethylase oxidoreductase [Pseudomonas aeruginosa]|nr:vanillate O-demethylase oxidoreductase [Pseudomonas aeruginosa]
MIEVIVGAIRLEAQDIHSFELFRADGATLPSFEPGAHIDLHLPNGLVRPVLPLRAGRAARHYRIAVLRCRDSRGGSAAVHTELRVGQRLRIGEPRNLFPLVHRARTAPAVRRRHRHHSAAGDGRTPGRRRCRFPAALLRAFRRAGGLRRLPRPLRLRRPRALPFRPWRQRPPRRPARPARGQSARHPAVPLRSGGLHALDRKRRPRPGLGGNTGCTANTSPPRHRRPPPTRRSS